MKILVSGATGYVASRLLPALVATGHDVRATSRNPQPIAERFAPVEAIPSDLFDEGSLGDALADIEVAYYLVHSMAGQDFEKRDREAARNFLQAAERAGVRRIIYLGGLGRNEERLSKHLKSRHEVGRILASGRLQVIELRAAIVVGSGSAAFEMLRHLTERLPMMIAPRWLNTKIQPVAEEDLVSFLVDAVGLEDDRNKTVELGGPDVLTYREMIEGYAQVRGLRRTILGVPVLTPRLSSYWVNLVTPVDPSVAKPLIDGLRNEVVVTDRSAEETFGRVPETTYRDAVARALRSQTDLFCAEGGADDDTPPGAFAGIIRETHRIRSRTTPEALADEIASIGGRSGWYPLRWAWWIRARLDDLFGGRGLRWERPEGPLRRGQRVDWWTVEDTNPRRLLLRAEMKTPGDAWLEWRIDETGLKQTAYFRPRGVLGRLYWWGLFPIHTAIFRLMAARLVRRAERRPPPPSYRNRYIGGEPP